jgi:hypothetical protein
MTIYLKQSTASQEIPLGHFVDSTDGVTAETALSIANTDIKVWKTGATTLVNKNSGGATHISGGIYYCVLDATDTDTLGPLVVFVAVSGALAVRLECVVLAANVYDSLIGGGDVLDVSVTQFGGTNLTQSGGRPEVNTSHWGGTAVASANVLIDGAITAAKIATDAITSAKIADGALTAAKFAAGALDAVWSTATRLLTAGTNIVLAKGTGVTGFNDPTAAAIADAVWDEAISGHQTASTFGREVTVGCGVLLDTTATGTPTSTTLQLTAGSTVDDFYNDQTIHITSGTGIGQARVVLDYVGATRTVTVDEPFATTPASGDGAVILSSHVHPVAQIKTALVEALSTDTYSEPGQGAPAATASLATKLGFLYKAWRNKKTQTASEYALFADDATTVDQKATVSDDGTTLTVGEIDTGP